MSGRNEVKLLPIRTARECGPQRPQSLTITLLHVPFHLGNAFHIHVHGAIGARSCASLRPFALATWPRLAYKWHSRLPHGHYAFNSYQYPGYPPHGKEHGTTTIGLHFFYTTDQLAFAYHQLSPCLWSYKLAQRFPIQHPSNIFDVSLSNVCKSLGGPPIIFACDATKLGVSQLFHLLLWHPATPCLSSYGDWLFFVHNNAAPHRRSSCPTLWRPAVSALSANLFVDAIPTFILGVSPKLQLDVHIILALKFVFGNDTTLCVSTAIWCTLSS